MKLNQWTLALAAGGVVSLGSVVMAEEAPHQVQTALSSTTLSGYVDTSAIWQLGNGKTATGRSYDGVDKQNGFNLNVVKLSLEKPLDEGQWSAGYKVDLLAGPDANTYASASPLATKSVGGAATTADFAIQQAYVDMRAPIGNGLDFKMGVFSTVVGYEVFDSPKNPNYSRSYGYQIEPLSHTGLLASYQVADWLSLTAGIADTWSQQINGRPYRAPGPFPMGVAKDSEKTYMGGFTLTAPESLGFLKGAQLYAGIVDGLPTAGGGTPGPSNSDITSYYVGATIPTPLTGFSVGASYDYRGTKQNSPVNPSSYANATALYLKYKATEKLSFANRTEYASGTLGTWNVNAFTKAHHDEFFADTVTVDYSLWANVITRAEFRWDHDLTGSHSAFATTGGGVGLAQQANNALSLALNVIYQF
jgi:hypothetical protein